MTTPHAAVPNLSDSCTTIVPPLQPDNPHHLTSYVLGVAGFLGGDDAISAMVTVSVYGNRCWLGWYNTPGSLQIAKRLGSFAKSATFHSISPMPLSMGVHADPTTLFGSDGRRGPKFRAAHSGTVIEETGYLAALLMKECTALDSEKVVPGRRTRSVAITIADLSQAPASEAHPSRSSAFTFLFASFPVAVSLGTCVLCTVRRDWYASSLILVGIVAGGISSLVLGSVDPVLTHPEPIEGSPASDGILGSEKDIVLLRGTEGTVSSITRFSLRFSNEAHFNLVRSCSVLFFIQFITQLLLILHASLFGQAMFLTSLGVSALYNTWLSSSDAEEIHRKLLFERVLQKVKLTKYRTGSHTVAVVFMLLVLQPRDPGGLLNELLPGDTKVWKQWKAMILEQLHRRSSRPFLSERDAKFLKGFTKQEQGLLQLLYDDARAAYIAYRDYLGIDLL